MRKGWLAVIVLLAGLAVAEESRVTLSLKGTTLGEAAATVAAFAKIEVEVSEAVAKLPLSIDLKDVTAEAALRAMAETAATDAEVVKLGEGKYRIRRKGEDDTPEAKIRMAMAETRVNISFADTSLDDALEFLGSKAGCTMTFDPAARNERHSDDLLVNLHADGVTIKNAVDLLTLTKGLAWDIRWGSVFVSSAERLKALPRTVLPVPGKDAPEWETKLRKALEDPISFAFASAGVSEALSFIRTLKGVNIVLAPEAKELAESAVLDLSVNSLRLGDALALMLLPRELTYRLESEVILIVKR